MQTVLDSLNTGLHQACAEDPGVYILGEDILDPYGGAFKVTRGLSSAFPGRVLTTPISEAGMTGVAVGMALRGLRPVVEIMFGDFITRAADQMINHAAKFRWMYNQQVRVPLVLRTPMGGRRGYGPTHSQSLEKLFLGAPGLRVLAPCALTDPGELLKRAILEGEDPTVFVENKLLYLIPIQDLSADFTITIEKEKDCPTIRIEVRDAPQPMATLAAYGHMAELARQAILRLAYEHEIFIELVVPTQLAPFEIDAIIASARRTGRLLTAEEGSLSLGWGAEVVARCAESLGSRLARAGRLAGRELPIPSSGPLETAVLPGVDDIIRAVQKLVQ